MLSPKGRFQPIILTDGQEAWLQQHYKHTKNEEIAKRLGISITSVSRFARRRGLKKSPQFMKKCLAETAAAANRSHRLNGTYPPKGFQIPNREKTQFKKGEKPIERLGAQREAERLAKCVESRKKTFKLEKARALFGLPRQTKMLVIKKPRKQIRMRHYLKKRGYIIERCSNVAYYNSETQRSLELESRPMTGFTFINQNGN